MSASFRIHREREAFVLSAICLGGVFPVRMCGRLQHLETEPKSRNNKDHTSTPFALPSFLPSLPTTGKLAARLRRVLPLLSRPFSSVVIIGNTRRLASVHLLRLSQPPRLSRDEEPRPSLEFFGAFVKAPLSLACPRNQLRQKFLRVPHIAFSPSFLSTAVVHEKKSNNGVSKCLTKEFPKTEKEFPRIT